MVVLMVGPMDDQRVGVMVGMMVGVKAAEMVAH